MYDVFRYSLPIFFLKMVYLNKSFYLFYIIWSLSIIFSDFHLWSICLLTFFCVLYIFSWVGNVFRSEFACSNCRFVLLHISSTAEMVYSIRHILHDHSAEPIVLAFLVSVYFPLPGWYIGLFRIFWDLFYKTFLICIFYRLILWSAEMRNLTPCFWHEGIFLFVFQWSLAMNVIKCVFVLEAKNVVLFCCC